LRISVDTKATVNIGEYSRHGRSRGLEPVKALDHDMRMKKKFIPGGILEPVSGKAFLFFTGSYKTSDFMVDGFLLWWHERKRELELSNLKCLVINMDNDPECSGRCTQFLLSVPPGTTETKSISNSDNVKRFDVYKAHNSDAK